MAKTDPIDIFKPPDRGESPGLGASRIRTLARAFVEMLGVDHYVGSATDGKYTEDAAGEHAKVTLRQTTKPGSVADKGFMYAKDVSGATELFYEDEAGNEIQLTTGGAIRLRSSDYTLANNTQLKAMNASGTGTVDIIKVNSSDKPQLADGAQLATSGAPTVDAQLVNKKYTDDQIVAAISAKADNLCNAWASFNASGVLQDSFNVASVTWDDTNKEWDVLFAAALPNANYAAVAVPESTDSLTDYMTRTRNKATAGFSIYFKQYGTTGAQLAGSFIVFGGA